MPVCDAPTLSASPARKPALMLTVAAVRLSAAASAMDSPASSVTGVAPETTFALAPAVSTGGRRLTDTWLVAEVDVLTPSLTDQVIVRVEVVAWGDAKATDSSSF